MSDQANVSNHFFASLKSGERAAQQQLYQSYAKAMYNICLRITGDADDAKDALQEAFIRIFKGLETFDKPELLPAWVKKITINAAINLVNKQKKQISVAESFHQEWQNDTKNENNEDDFDEALLKVEAVKRKIQALPDGFRIVFSLYVLEGYDHQEIAEILGISVSTSKTQLSRARQKLLTMLKNN